MKDRRVVITGMGVVSPNGIGIDSFTKSLINGVSGIKYNSKMKELNYRSQIGGAVDFEKGYIESKISKSKLNRMSSVMINALIAALECFDDANLKPKEQKEDPYWDIGAIIGACSNGISEIITEVTPKLNEGLVKKLGISIIEKTMASGVSSIISGTLGLGNKVSTNSSACATGAEAILDGYYHIKSGRARKMLCGGAEGSTPYTWAGFDTMRIISSKYNDSPENASRPFSESSNTFVAGSGAGILLLEDYEEAKKRGAKIYAEILGGHTNSGGQRLGGTMTASNSTAIQRCIKTAFSSAKITPNQIDYVNGHFTGTAGDLKEFQNWIEVLNLDTINFPYVNSTKSLIGHTLSAAGAIETIATIIQMKENFIHQASNSEDLYKELLPYRNKIPLNKVDTTVNIAIKSSFGFGDVNTVLILKKPGLTY